MIYYKTSELYHHGILGQKWGVRNGPPYPLGAGDHSAREKKAGWTKSVSKPKSSGSASATKTSDTGKSNNVSNGKSFVQRHLSKTDKAGSALAAVIGISYIAAIMGAVAARNIAYKKEISSNLKNADPGEFKKVSKPTTPDNDMKVINKGYESGLAEYRMNCTMCSAAYEMRRRGYDVEANTTKRGRKVQDATKWFNVDEKNVNKYRMFNDFKSSLSKEPEGARGSIFTGYGDFDSYHCMVWEKKNGKIIIRDCQNGKVYKSIDASPINRQSRINYTYYRTDNATINFDAIKDAVKNRSAA